MPVHLFGRPAPVDELRGSGSPIIEDAAQAFGAPGIATSIASTFSFFPTKNLFALGDGGLIAVNDAELAKRLRMLRFHGSRRRRTSSYVGYNSRLDALQAAMLRIFLPHLDGWNAAAPRGGGALRRARARRGRRAARRRAGPRLPHVLRPLVRARPRSPPRSTRPRSASPSYYEPPLHLQPALRYLGYAEGDLPETEKAARENLCLPMWAGISEEQQAEVVASCGAHRVSSRRDAPSRSTGTASGSSSSTRS